jgi:ubiquinone/menaquinone biosynthesis C-methylase UbiE
MWSIYNHPKLYAWYMRKRLYWVEDFRKTIFIDTIGKYLSGEDRVLDVACGTGVNCLLIAENHPDVQITGIDLNPAIIQFAEESAKASGLKNVSFTASDFADVGEGTLDHGPDMIICTLGLSVIPDWEKAIEHAYSLLKPGGHFVVMDLHFEKYGVRDRLMHLWVNRVFSAYHDRPIVKKLRGLFLEKDFHLDAPTFLFVGQKA